MATVVASTAASGAIGSTLGKANASPAKSTPVASSMIGYRGEIGTPQWRHRPRSTNHETTGMLSSAPSSVSQDGQCDGGRETDMWRGNR
jgi:hypothetical protein